MNLIKQCFMTVTMLCCVAAMNSCVPGGDISPKSPKDLVGDWVTEYPEDGVFEGAAYDRVIEHYSFSLNESGYFEQFLLNDNELVGAKYVRGPKSSFRYRLVATGDIGVMAASDGHYWKMKLADGVLVDPDDNTEYTRATELMKKQMTFLVNCLTPGWLADQLIGKWMIADIEGEPATTNRKTVMTFVSPTTAFISRSFDKPDDDRPAPPDGQRPDFVPGEGPGPDHRPGRPGWDDYEEFNVTIDGNMVTLDIVGQTEHKRTTTHCILDISDTGFLSEFTLPVRPGGPQGEAGDREVRTEKQRFEKIEANFEQAAIGLWEGKVTSADDEYTDGQLHRWEFKDDGTYVYYRQDESGKWVDDVNEFADYFIDGTLLCMRWKNVGEGQEENREWWEIESIDDGVMKWKGLRMREDGSTYTATFQMTEVPAVAPTLVLFGKSGNAEFWQQMTKAFTDACIENNMVPLPYLASDDAAYQEQIEDLKEVAEQLGDAVKGIIYAPCYDIDGYSADVQIAFFAALYNIPVVILDTPVEASSFLASCPFFGTDNKAAAEDLAKLVVGEKVASIALPSGTGKTRTEAFNAARPETVTHYCTLDNTEDLVKNLIDEYDTFVFFNGSQANVALAELKKAGKAVYTFDVYESFLEELNAGSAFLKGVVAQNTFGMAKKAVEAVLSGATEGEMVPTFYVTKDNLDDPALQPFIDFYREN